jgi:hypothetical protein
LQRIPQRKSGTDYQTLKSVASTYQNLAAAIADGDKPNQQVEEYFRKAAQGFEQILQRGQADKSFIPEKESRTIHISIARAYRGAHDYNKALDGYAAILKQNENQLLLQAEAAETYQLQAANDAQAYVRAIEGGPRGGKAESIWGWAVLAKKIAQLSKFRDNFHRARYNLTLCRHRFALTQATPEAKQQILNAAKGGLRNTWIFDSTLGGETSKAKYDALLREIQKSLGQPELGLQEFEQKNN